MAQINLGNIEIDTKKYAEEAAAALQRSQRNAIDHILNNLFMSVRDRQSTYTRTDKDSGFLYDFCLNNILDCIKDDEYTKKAQEYINQQFDKHLKEALDEAMRHKARAIAFKRIGEQAPRDGDADSHEVNPIGM